MNFVDAIDNQESRTTNGMKALATSGSELVDLFYKIGASRGKDIIPYFVKAYVNNPEIALRIALWARDIRGGAGERQIFRDIMKYLENTDKEILFRIMEKVPELGRWDDLLIFDDPKVKTYAYGMIKNAILANNGLCAKWMPRKGKIASELRNFLKLSPKEYRKILVNLTKVVETQMCKNDWDNIEFSHVPSLASTRYKKAFSRHTPKFEEYVNKLANKDETVHINAGAVYPYDIIKNYKTWTEVDKKHADAQWDALPNYVGLANAIPVVDVSGSMTWVQLTPSLQPLDVAISLGLYMADKNKGVFKNIVMEFSNASNLHKIKGSISKKLDQIRNIDVGGSTNLHSVFEKILTLAVNNNVKDSDLPKNIVIFSDMQFNYCVRHDDSAMEMIRRKYEENNYTVPNIIFWNLNDHDNIPVRNNESGTVLVSGFSPSLMKILFNSGLEKINPYDIMMETIKSDRYKF